MMTAGNLYSADRLCPFTLRVLVAASELGILLDVKYGNEIPDEVRAANSSGKWPIFLEQGASAPVADSARIVARLIEVAGPRGEAYRCDAGLLQALDGFVENLGPVICAGDPRVQAERRPKLEASLAMMAGRLREHGGAYLAGAAFSQAEGHVAPFLHRMAFLGEIRAYFPAALRDDPALRDWIDRTTTHASFARVKPTIRTLRVFYEKAATYGKAMKIGRLHHSAFRAMWDDMQARIERLASAEREGPGDLAETRGLCVVLFRAVALHAKLENLSLFPTFDAVKNDPAFTQHGATTHAHEAEVMNDLLARFNEAAHRPVDERRAALEHVARGVTAHRDDFFAHLAYEEAHYLPLLVDLDVPTHIRLLKVAYEMCLAERPLLIGIVVAYMPKENRLSFIDSLSQAVEPDHPQWRLVMGRIHQHLDEDTWLRIVHLFEDIVPTSLKLLPAGHKRPTLAAAAAELEAAYPLERIEIPNATRQ